MREYNHKKIEPKWQKYWESKKLNQAKENSKKKKFYGLIEFPYPSGDGLHVGHIRSNTAMDVIARKRRAEGFEVLYPIGWDAFGLPTENYAIKTGIHPTIVTKKNTTNFRRQLKALGFSFDWSREVNTTDPTYYKWTQWIFLKFLEKGLAYKKRMAINWCPKDKIGLANEEVVDGCCERCGTLVEKRDKEQWMLAITKYADRLDKDLDLKKILIGTRNPAKVKMIKCCFADVPEVELVTLDDLPPIDDSMLIEGGDFLENARLKSEFYFKKTGIPTISTDHILWIEKWKENNGFMVHMRKHANPQSPRATDEEVIVFLKDFLKGVGGTSPANFHYAISYTDETESFVVDEVPNNYILQLDEAKSYWPGYPTEALLKDASTGVFKAEQSDDVRYKKVIQLFQEKFVPRIFKGQIPPDYLEKIRVQQKNWIGRSEGVNLKLKIKDLGIEVSMYDSIPQTFSAQTFTVIAPEHSLVPQLVAGTKCEKEVLDFAENIKRRKLSGEFADDKSPEGIFTGRFIEYPLTGRLLPIWVASYALVDYGTGIVNCSAHDERDFAFAKKYGIELHPVLIPNDPELAKKVLATEIFYREPNGILQEPIEFKGRRWDEARVDIISYLVSKGWAERAVNYKLRDWVFSRQRYWGEPIPVIHCGECGIVPVPEKDLPVKLPTVKNYKPTDTGESPLAAISKWVNVKCPTCKAPAKRETDTMPNWAGSSWYYLRYVDPKNTKAFADAKALQYWTPVDWYNGGMEHTTLHVLYSRFWHKFLFDIGLVPATEPYRKRTSHGLVLGEGGVKMSKSLGNVVNPDALIEMFGADTLRVYEMFMGPFDQHIAWSTDAMIGPRRFLERVWKLQFKIQSKKLKAGGDKAGLPGMLELESLLHRTIKKVSEDIETMRFNTAVSSLMVLVNDMERGSELSRSAYEILLKLLAPFAPHITDELWSILGHSRSIHIETWPAFDPEKASSGTKIIVVQVNGKVRTSFEVDAEITEADAEARARTLPELVKWIEGKTVKRVVYVKGKLLNFVV